MFKTLLLTIMFVLLIFIGSSQNVKGDVLDLSKFRWKNRLLLLFAPDRSHPFFEHLHQSLGTQKAETLERDLIIFEILESGSSRINSAILDPMISRTFREKFEAVPGEFMVVLMGKDGGIKLKRRERTELKDIFGLIDSMPMRHEEVRQKNR